MRDAEGLGTMDGMVYLTSVPEKETIKNMVVHEGKLYVSTDKHIYTLEDEKRLERIYD